MVRLLHLQIDPKLRDRLEKLAVRTVSDFLALPAGGIAQHLGEQAWRLYRFASGTLSLPIQSRKIPEPLRVRMDLDEPESNAQRLLFWIRGRWIPCCGRRRQGVRRWRPCICNCCWKTETGIVSASSRQGRLWKRRSLLDLLRLHLETVSFRTPPGGIGPRGGGRDRLRRNTEPAAAESTPQY